MATNKRIVQGPGIKKTNTRKIRTNQVKIKQIYSFKVKGKTRESIVSQVANRLGIQQKNIKDDLLKYLDDMLLSNQVLNDLCLYNVCCNGDINGREWYMECKE